MFVDRVQLTISSGKGGAGAVAFRKEKFVIKGGPEGGDGGRGGDVYFQVDNNCDTLSAYRGRHVLKAKNGQQGGARNMSGRSGESITLIVPPGTSIIDNESGETLLDLQEVGACVRFLEGGKGGLGNARFKSSTNQRPTYAQPGLPGTIKDVTLELKLIADIGLVGFPNVGKSTLISTISSAKPEVANYEFTTITPNLGVVDVGDYTSIVMADIPGIIEGASDGRGLGLEFLRHIERTKNLLFMLDIANYRTLQEQFDALQTELERYSSVLAAKSYAIAITRIDAIDSVEVDEKVRQFLDYNGFDEKSETSPLFVLPISSVTRNNIDQLVKKLGSIVLENKAG